MLNDLTRRRALAGVSALVFGPMPARAELADEVTDLERRAGGRLGFYAVDSASDRSLEHRADERFVMCSTFKGLLGAQILSRVDAGVERLDRKIKYTASDLIFTSPVTKQNVEVGSLSVEELCRAIVEVSDNTAAILLMRSAGGPKGLTEFIRSLGDKVTRSDRYEPDSNNYSGELDTTTPRAIADSARAILLGDVLSRSSRQLLTNWMIATHPGSERLKAAFPRDWVTAQRPGTSEDRETNNYLMVTPPGKPPLFVAAYLDAPNLALEQRESVLRQAGQIFVRWATARDR